MKQIISFFKRHIGTGLLTILPVVGTVWILSIIYGFFNNINMEFIEKHLGFKIPGLQVILLLIATFILGFIVNTAMGKTLLKYWNKSMTKIPVVKGVYGGIKQLTDTLSHRGDEGAARVVLAEWPRKGAWQIGFVTRDAWEPLREETGKELVAVFIPTAPNPTGGYMTLIPEKDLIPLDISYNEGMKYVVSGGVVLPEPEAKE